MSELLRVDNSLYWHARNYAFYLCRRTGLNFDYRDIVHNAYINYYNNNGGGNLFETNKTVVFRKVKNAWWSAIQTKRIMIDGEYFPKIRYQVLEDSDPEFLSYKFIPTTPSNNIENLVDYGILKDKVHSVLSDKHKLIVDSLEDGCNTQQIADQMGTYRQLVTHEIKQIREKVKQVL